MLADYLLLALVGFAAQLVDGALGMAFGLISSSAMLAMGMPPAQASAIAHTAEIFTTASSATSHVYHRNVDWRLVVRLGLAGVIGAVLGAWVLSNIDSSAARPYIAVYLLIMGLLILAKAVRQIPPRDAPAVWAPPLGFAGGFLDASGGGGWGPIVTSTLIGSGHAPRTVVGSVNTTELFVASAAAATFFVELGLSPLYELAALVSGGVLAAPLGGWMVKRLRPRVLMTLVGLIIVTLSLFQLARAFKFM
ncbi:MAG TPA: sulfite exporter TauE/SafE family protein [Xanthobacteraceae bacterium]|nr:sulfite exporter TauE/SafE family protein [Xanthobacteraceae bacterium]